MTDTRSKLQKAQDAYKNKAEPFADRALRWLADRGWSAAYMIAIHGLALYGAVCLLW